MRRLVWSIKRSEIYSGGEDGTIAFLDAKKTAPICKFFHYIGFTQLDLLNEIDGLKAHNDGITKLQLLDKDNILVTGGKDKQIRVESF